SASLSGAFNGDRIDRHFLHRTVLRTALHFGNLVGDVLAFHHFAEDGVIAGEPWRCRHGDEELAPVRSWPGIGHGQFACLVELVRRPLGLVAEFVSWAAHAGATGIAALDHEIRDHAMENGPAVEWSVAAFATHGILPAPLALRKVSEVL